MVIGVVVVLAVLVWVLVQVPGGYWPLLALAGLLFYAAVCWIRPYSICFKCAAEGKIGARKCRRCKATGRKLRLGRRIFNYYYNRRKSLG